jgi:hypothetical protein
MRAAAMHAQGGAVLARNDTEPSMNDTLAS